LRLDLAELAQQHILSGSLAGKRLFTQLVGQTHPTSEVELCFLDFEKVQVATSSFLRDSVVAYRDYVRRQYPTLYPIGVNVNGDVREELHSFLSSQRDAWIICKLDEWEQASSAAVVGHLEGRASETLMEVIKRGETDAPTLAMASDPEGTAAPTVWNNRLAALCEKGILIELNRGRPRRYKPVIEGLSHGS
jgi:hypothetical protein